MILNVSSKNKSKSEFLKYKSKYLIKDKKKGKMTNKRRIMYV